jgi:hypothetical protein
VSGVATGASSASGGGCVVVDPLTLGYLARVALGGPRANDDRVAYVGDSLPQGYAPGLPAAPHVHLGDTLRFTVSIRNVGWNVIRAANVSLHVAVSGVQLLRRSLSQAFGVGDARIPTAGSPLRAALRRHGYVVACSVLETASAVASDARFEVSSDIEEGMATTIAAELPIPAATHLLASCAGVDAGDVVAAIVTVRYSLFRDVDSAPMVSDSSTTASAFAVSPRERDVVVLSHN